MTKQEMREYVKKEMYNPGYLAYALAIIDRLLNLPEDTSRPDYKFELGARVEVFQPSSTMYHREIGIVVGRGFRANVNRYAVKLCNVDGSPIVELLEDEMVLSAPEPKFKVGDVVKCAHPTTTGFSVATINTERDDTGCYCGEYLNGGYMCRWEHELELIYRDPEAK